MAAADRRLHSPRAGASAMTPRVNLAAHTSGEETIIYRVSTQHDRLRLRSGTGTSYAILGHYRKGTEVVVLDTANAEWYEVVCPDGKRCYMHAGYLICAHPDDVGYGCQPGGRAPPAPGAALPHLPDRAGAR